MAISVEVRLEMSPGRGRSMSAAQHDRLALMNDFRPDSPALERGMMRALVVAYPSQTACQSVKVLVGILGRVDRCMVSRCALRQDEPLLVAVVPPPNALLETGVRSETRMS